VASRPASAFSASIFGSFAPSNTRRNVSCAALYVLIPSADCDTICGLLDSIKDKLDGDDSVIGKFSGQIMARIYEENKIAECYGVRLPADWSGEVPSQMLLLDVPTADYIVFEHGAFDYEQESETVGEKLQNAIDAFDYNETGYTPDNITGRLSYFYFDPEKWEKRVLPVKRMK